MAFFVPKKGDLIILTTHIQVGDLTPKELETLIVQSLDADKAEDIISIDLDDQCGLADKMIIASGTSSRHVHGIANNLADSLRARGS